MMYSSTLPTNGANNMWFFGKRRNIAQSDAKEAQIQAIRQETLGKIDEAAKSTERLNKLLEKDGGVTYMLFLATGGDRRNGRTK